MSITLDFLLLFFLFIIPGLVFKRIFFFKEFSKQFSIKDNAYTIIFFSFIPGLIFQILGFYIYWLVHEPDFSLYDVFQSLKNESDAKEMLISKNLGYFALHQLNVNVLALFSGFITSRLIRVLGLDVRTKYFRFSNQWYYVFSGEIESFDKFKKFNSRFGINIKGRNEFKYYPPKVDILLEGSDGQKLYSGYLVDYDLNPKDIHSLDKVYLKHAFRYRPKRDEDNTSIIKGNTARVPVKGDVFVLNTTDFVNMNVTFVPTPEKVVEENKARKEKYYKLLYILGVAFNIYVLFDVLLFDMILLKNIFSKDLANQILSQSWYTRILISSILNLGFSLLLPIQDDKSKTYSYHGWFNVAVAKIILLVVFGGISYLLWR